MASVTKVPTGYVFWDVSANKSYTAGQSFPTLGHGDYLCPATSSYDTYYHIYWYNTSDRRFGVSYTNGWNGYVQAQYRTQANQVAPFDYIAGKPVVIFEYYACTNLSNPPDVSNCYNLKCLSFQDCTKLTSVPTMPSNLESIAYSFQNTKITSVNLSRFTKVKYAWYAFDGCSSLSTVTNISSMTKLEDATSMFRNCTSLTSFPSMENLTSLIYAKTTFSGCTKLTSAPTLPPNVTDLGWMFYGCTKLASAPEIPSSVTSIYQMFYGCTSLTGDVIIHSQNIGTYTEAFKNTAASKQIVLYGTPGIYSTLKKIASTGNNGNVYAGVSVSPSSFTAIRGIYEGGIFTENVNGDYCKLTVSYSVPKVDEAIMRSPTVKVTINGTETDISNSLSWYTDNIGGTQLSNTDGKLSTVSTLVTTSKGLTIYKGLLTCVYSLGSSDTSNSFTLNTNVYYYDGYYTHDCYTSGIVNASLAYSNLIIDINSTGTGMAIGDEAADDFNGLLIAKELYLAIDTSASSGTLDGDLYAALTTLGWNTDSDLIES